MVMMALSFTLACGDSGGDDGPDDSDNFDREAMLANWADNIIIPAYDHYLDQLRALQSSKEAFISEPTMDNLSTLRTDFRAAYMAWQQVSMFEIGPAETVTLRNFTNIYPTDVSEIEDHVSMGGANLELPSNNDSQGLPAIDYLLYGVGADDAAILSKLSETSYQNYLSVVVDRLHTLTDGVRTAWVTDVYRDEFVGASGSSATSSVNKMINDFMFYYEKSLRAGKVGIPAGVFNGNPLSDRAEAPYAGDLSRELLQASFSSVMGFFRGDHFDNSGRGPSLGQYLDDVQAFKGSIFLSRAISNQSALAQEDIQKLRTDLKTQVEIDNAAMLTAYDELQELVVLFKVDMFQALNVQVDFVDADGD